MFYSKNRSVLLFLFVSIFIQSCVSIYQGPDINSDGIAVLIVIDKDTSISNVDGKATTSRSSFAIKGKFERKLVLLPEKHEVILIHGGWRGVSSKAVYELEARKGNTYLVQSKTIGNSTAMWFEDEKSKERVGRIFKLMSLLLKRSLWILTLRLFFLAS